MNGFLGEFGRMLDRFLTPAVKTIFLINIVVSLVLLIVGSLKPGFDGWVVGHLAQYALDTVRGQVWRLLTYMFIHVQILHLAFNMLALWFFAPALEDRWGTRRFWTFYLTAGVGAGLVHTAVALLTGQEAYSYVIGASGAIFAVMLAYAAYYPEAVVMIYGVFPMKIKHLMIILIFLEFMTTAGGGGRGVSNLTHLSGLAIAYVYLSLYHKEWDIRRWQWR